MNLVARCLAFTAIIAVCFMPAVTSSTLSISQPAVADAAPAAPANPAPVVTPTVTLPAAKTGVVGRNVYLCPTTTCTPPLKWRLSAGLQQDTEIALRDPLAIAVYSDVAGSYTVDCWGAVGGQASDIATCTVTINSLTPPAPPVPPAPPAPSALTVTFETAYNLDTDLDRATSLEFLQGVFEGMAQQAPTWTNVTTVAQASAKIQSIVEAPNVGLTSTKLVNLRKAIQAELVSKFGSTGTAPISITALAAELNVIAQALKGVS